MRILVFACAMVAQGAVALRAQSVSDIIAPERRHHDYGAVAKASKAEHRFILHNPYATDLVIQSIRTSCGCTTPTIENKVIKPGEDGALVAKFNTDRFNGEKKATLTLAFSQPQFTELQLNVRGYIRTDIVLQPYEAAFGSVVEGSERRLDIDLSYAGRGDWTIQDITCPFSFIRANFREVSRQGSQVKYAIEILLDGSAPTGFFENQLVIHTNDNRLKTFPIHVNASIESPLRTAPASVALGKVKPNEAKSQRLTMTSRSDFQVLDISCDIAEIRYESPVRASRVHMLQLVIVPKPAEVFVDQEMKGKILIKTDLDDVPVEIPLSYSFETDKLAEAHPSS